MRDEREARRGTGRRSARTSLSCFPPLLPFFLPFFPASAPPPKHAKQLMARAARVRQCRTVHSEPSVDSNRVPTAELEVHHKFEKSAAASLPLGVISLESWRVLPRAWRAIFLAGCLVQAAVSAGVSSGAHRFTLTRAAKAGASSACIPSTRSCRCVESPYPPFFPRSEPCSSDPAIWSCRDYPLTICLSNSPRLPRAGPGGEKANTRDGVRRELQG